MALGSTWTVLEITPAVAPKPPLTPPPEPDAVEAPPTEIPGPAPGRAAASQPTDDDPVANEPVADEPVAHEPVADQPAVAPEPQTAQPQTAAPLPAGPDARTAPRRPWHRFYAEGVAADVGPLDGRSIGEVFEQTAARRADRPALHFYGRTFSYAELAESVNHLAASLAELGVGPADRVALHLPNCPQYVQAFFAALKCGASVVQVSPLLAAPEVDWCLLRSGAKVLVTLDNLLPTVKAGRAPPRLAATLVACVGSCLPSWQRWMDSLWHLRERSVLYRGLRGTWKTFDTVLWSKNAPPAAGFNPETTEALLQGTGGTTGRQKFAVLSHANLLANAAQVSAWGRVGEDDVVLSAPPFTHAYGVTLGLVAPLLAGAQIAVPAQFTPTGASELIERHRVTMAALVPPMASLLAREQKRSKRDLSSLRFAICGGSALPPAVKDEFERCVGAPVYQGYGLSEASPVTHCNPIGTGAADNVPGSIGLPLPGTDARVVSGHEPSEWRDLDVGEVGELLVRGPQVMMGYLGGSDERGLCGGWLPTGDLAYRDERGYFFLTGRRKDMILTNGLNVYPVEVEEVLRQHPCVADAVAVAEGHPQRGEVVKAVVVMADGCRPDPVDLGAFCAERLAKYKCPRKFEFVDELPARLRRNGIPAAARRHEELEGDDY